MIANTKKTLLKYLFLMVVGGFLVFSCQKEETTIHIQPNLPASVLSGETDTLAFTIKSEQTILRIDLTINDQLSSRFDQSILGENITNYTVHYLFSPVKSGDYNMELMVIDEDFKTAKYGFTMLVK